MFYNPTHTHVVVDLADGEELADLRGPGRFLVAQDGSVAAWKAISDQDLIKTIIDPLNPEPPAEPAP